MVFYGKSAAKVGCQGEELHNHDMKEVGSAIEALSIRGWRVTNLDPVWESDGEFLEILILICMLFSHGWLLLHSISGYLAKAVLRQENYKSNHSGL